MPNPVSDLKAKRELETTLLASMRGLFKRLAKEIRDSLSSSLTLPDIQPIAQPNIELRLNSHYKRVVREFGDRLSAIMPTDLKPGEIEAFFIETEILTILSARAVDQAILISNTTKDSMIWANRKGHQAVVEDDSLDHTHMPQIVANIFITRQLAIAGSIARTETQMAAETAKGVEAMRLVGIGTGEIKKRTEQKVAYKTWMSQGDSRVRPADGIGPFDHLAADQQRVRIDEAFIVSGERLMWPGDRSYGASSGNIIGCRCSAVYDEESFISLRETFLLALFLDLEIFPATESSLIVSGTLGL